MTAIKFFSKRQQLLRRRSVVLAAFVAFTTLFLSRNSSGVFSFQPPATSWRCTTTRRRRRSSRTKNDPPRFCSVALLRREVSRSADTNILAKEEENDEQASSSAGLQFKASLDYLTRSVPLPSTRNKTISDFFRTDAYLLLPVGTNNQITNVKPATPEQLERWREEAKHVGGVPPEFGDKVLELSITTPFLVFTIHVVATLGLKLLLPSPSSSDEKKEKEQRAIITSPEYQFTWIHHKFYAEGPQPFVWMFNQLTGLDQGRGGRGGRIGGSDSSTNANTDFDDKKFEQPNHGIYRVKSVVSDDGTRMAFALRMASVLNVKFPKALLQILPVDKKIIEEKGNLSLLQGMKRDIPPGVDKFRESYLEWMES